MKKAEYGLTGDFIFKEAVEFLKKKIPLKLGEYREISDECKGKAFTVCREEVFRARRDI